MKKRQLTDLDTSIRSPFSSVTYEGGITSALLQNAYTVPSRAFSYIIFYPQLGKKKVLKGSRIPATQHDKGGVEVVRSLEN
jgi:hypothetical protein